MFAGEDFGFGGDDVFFLADGGAGGEVNLADDADGFALVDADDGEAGGGGAGALFEVAG